LPRHFFEKEFEFVEAVSQEVWAWKGEADHRGLSALFFRRESAGLTWRRRRSLRPALDPFFHSTQRPLDAGLIRQARASLWSDDAPRCATQRRFNAVPTREAGGLTGYVLRWKASRSCRRTREGQPYLVGQPGAAGFGWLKPEEMPFHELPAG